MYYKSLLIFIFSGSLLCADSYPTKYMKLSQRHQDIRRQGAGRNEPVKTEVDQSKLKNISYAALSETQKAPLVEWILKTYRYTPERLIPVVSFRQIESGNHLYAPASDQEMRAGEKGRKFTRQELEIMLNNGATFIVLQDQKNMCQNCRGFGVLSDAYRKKCPACKGDGQIEEKKFVSIGK